jgi:hypothetical protein
MISLPISSLNNTNGSNIVGLVKIKKNCENSHKHCLEIVDVAKINLAKVTQEYLNEFFTLFKTSSYNCCLSSYNNTKSNEIKKFITKCSEFLNVPTWDSILLYFSDDEMLTIIQNQKKRNTNFVETILNLDVFTNYGSRNNFINALMTQPVKSKSFENIIMSMELGQFSRYLNKTPKQGSSVATIDNVIIKFIHLKKESLKENCNKEIGIKIINSFINKPNIIKQTYLLVSSWLNSEQKKEIFNKSISLYDRDLMLLLLENKDIIPDITTINKLVEKCYARPEGSPNGNQIAEIIDMLCEYGLVVNKDIVIKLLEHGCYVNNLEKHGLEVDSEILAKCAHLSYYPYKFDIKPNVDILIKECSKHDNLNTIKKLKEFGGVFTSACLEEACGVAKNGRVIKYLVNDCGVNVTDKCLERFQDAYKIEAIDVLLKRYKSQNPNNKVKETDQNNILELDKESVMFVTPKNIIIDIDDNDKEYNLRSKIKKFFDYKKSTIKYLELYQLFLKYLISNKLVIGNYFIINNKLSNLLKVNHCTIMNIEQIHNILTYFIEEPNNDL